MSGLHDAISDIIEETIVAGGGSDKAAQRVLNMIRYADTAKADELERCLSNARQFQHEHEMMVEASA